MTRLLASLLFLLAWAVPARAAQADDPGAALQQAARSYRSISLAVNDGMDAATRRALRDRADQLRQTVEASTAQASTSLVAIDAQLAQLGQPLPGATEAADIRAERRTLAQQRSMLDSQVKRGRLLGVQIDQLQGDIGGAQASAFSERISTRVPSPVLPAFWDALYAAWPHDMRRGQLLLSVEQDAISSARRGAAWPALAGLSIALLLIFPIRLWLRGLGRRVAIDHAPASRLRRSGHAAWLVAIGTLLPFAATLAALAGARSGGLIAPGWEPIAAALLRGATVAGLICGLGAGLVMRRQPSWRLLPLSDSVARALRPWTWGAAGLVLVVVLLDGLRRAAGISAAGRTGTDAIITASHILFVAGVLVHVTRLRVRAIATGEAVDDGAGETGTAIAAIAAWVMLATALATLLLGYVGLSLLVARMLLWLPLVGATFYLLLVLVDDLCTAAIAHDSALGLGLHRGFGIRASVIDQVGVFLSAALRVILLLVGVTIAAGPFGSNLDTLFDQLGRIARGVTIGEVTISPGAVARSVGVLAIGLLIVRGLQRWLTDRYLPVTELDAGARNSIAMVARYAGLILVALWALASLGIGIERIALLLSALSVGIGFGLQAITQNFVSGLILLAERPVKIGDLVRIGDQEGDVKRISVRATEIQIADRSTLIVPNSELITKTIRNMTMADPLGRIQLQFSVQIGTDVAKLRDMMFAMFGEEAAVLADPAPVVFVDSIGDGRININSFAYVSSPRDSYPTRSKLLFRLLSELPAAGIDLDTAPQQLRILPRAAADV